jgi:hypothetical protein
MIFCCEVLNSQEPFVPYATKLLMYQRLTIYTTFHLFLSIADLLAFGSFAA